MTLSNVSITLRHLREIDLVRYEISGMTRRYWIKLPCVLEILGDLETFVASLRELGRDWPLGSFDSRSS